MSDGGISTEIPNATSLTESFALTESPKINVVDAGQSGKDNAEAHSIVVRVMSELADGPDQPGRGAGGLEEVARLNLSSDKNDPPKGPTVGGLVQGNSPEPAADALVAEMENGQGGRKSDILVYTPPLSQPENAPLASSTNGAAGNETASPPQTPEQLQAMRDREAALATAQARSGLVRGGVVPISGGTTLRGEPASGTLPPADALVTSPVEPKTPAPLTLDPRDAPRIVTDAQRAAEDKADRDKPKGPGIKSRAVNAVKGVGGFFAGGPFGRSGIDASKLSSSPSPAEQRLADDRARVAEMEDKLHFDHLVPRPASVPANEYSGVSIIGPDRSQARVPVANTESQSSKWENESIDGVDYWKDPSTGMYLITSEPSPSGKQVIRWVERNAIPREKQTYVDALRGASAQAPADEKPAADATSFGAQVDFDGKTYTRVDSNTYTDADGNRRSATDLQHKKAAEQFAVPAAVESAPAPAAPAVAPTSESAVPTLDVAKSIPTPDATFGGKTYIKRPDGSYSVLDASLSGMDAIGEAAAIPEGEFNKRKVESEVAEAVREDKLDHEAVAALRGLGLNVGMSSRENVRAQLEGLQTGSKKDFTDGQIDAAIILENLRIAEEAYNKITGLGVNIPHGATREQILEEINKKIANPNEQWTLEGEGNVTGGYIDLAIKQANKLTIKRANEKRAADAVAAAKTVGEPPPVTTSVDSTPSAVDAATADYIRRTNDGIVDTLNSGGIVGEGPAAVGQAPDGLTDRQRALLERQNRMVADTERMAREAGHTVTRGGVGGRDIVIGGLPPRGDVGMDLYNTDGTVPAEVQAARDAYRARIGVKGADRDARYRAEGSGVPESGRAPAPPAAETPDVAVEPATAETPEQVEIQKKGEIARKAFEGLGVSSELQARLAEANSPEEVEAMLEAMMKDDKNKEQLSVLALLLGVVALNAKALPSAT